MADRTRLFVGTSGWAYSTWKPEFYPKGVSAKKFLSFYASVLGSVEVNYTFGSVLKPGQLQGWLDDTPPHFRFSFKAPQRITHFSRLRACEDALSAFFASLEPAQQAGKLGYVLFQLPPSFQADLPRLATFLEAMHGPQAPRIAFEFRHPSWFGEETYKLLREHQAAVCLAESEELQTPEVHTAQEFTCFRLRWPGGYTPEQIAGFAARFRLLARSREVFVYFKHEDAPTGGLNALALLRELAE